MKYTTEEKKILKALEKIDEQNLFKNLIKLIDEVHIDDIIVSSESDDRMKKEGVPEINTTKNIKIVSPNGIINFSCNNMQVPFHSVSNYEITIENNNKIKKIDCSKDVIKQLIEHIEQKIENSSTLKM